MKRKISIGNQDFKSLRENHCFYIDKSSFIREWWENQDVVTLITRPRRFGKTLNLSMVDYFFSIRNAKEVNLFTDLSIWKEESFHVLQGSYPVLFLSFADVKATSYPDARLALVQKILRLYGEYRKIFEKTLLTKEDRDFLQMMSSKMSDATAAISLNYLSELLQRYYKKKVIILLDEYDTPLQEAYLQGYWKEMTGFIRSLLNATFKTNPFLERGLLTGITRVSKESIFSDLNNLEVVTTISDKYQTSFGFTSKEVEQALLEYDLLDERENVRYWYDGFRFGRQNDMYNPWSITKFLDCGRFAGYWANSSSNELAGKFIREGSANLKIKMESLLRGEEIFARIDEEISFDQLNDQEDAVWSLLLASGYVKVTSMPDDENDIYGLALTNHEIENMFRKMIRTWFGNPSAHYNEFVRSLLLGDIENMNRFINQMSQTVFSFFDTGNRPCGQEPERFYHGFVLGLLVDTSLNYTITSNRESGFGRYDVMMEPYDKAEYAYILEFKVRDPNKEGSLEDTIQAALKQITEKKYAASLISRGFSLDKIRCYGFAFEGKKVLIG